MPHEYKLKYRHEALDTPVSDRDECERLTEEGFGLCDAVFGASLIWPEGGGMSCYFVSVDGRNEGRPLPDEDWFRVWELLTKRLSASQTLSEAERRFTGAVFQSIREIFYGMPPKD